SLPELHILRRRARKLLDTLKPDLVYTVNVKSASLAMKRHRQWGIAVHLRGWYTPDMIPPHARWLLRNRCDALLAVSRATRAALICAGMHVDKTFVLHNSIDAEAIVARATQPLEGPL